MDRLHYAGDSILTGTLIAEAVLEYAHALALAGTSATVVIPTINEDGTHGRSELLVGPASQLISDTEDSEYDEVIDGELVARMRGEAAQLRLHGAHSPTAGVTTDQPASAPDFDIRS
ncbi:MAG TPA: hypothetical protein VEX88_11280 [Glaciibacter sp.]|nr:hypothetical protein [Glaciibacter sp.]